MTIAVRLRTTNVDDGEVTGGEKNDAEEEAEECRIR